MSSSKSNESIASDDQSLDNSLACSSTASMLKFSSLLDLPSQKIINGYSFEQSMCGDSEVD